MGCDIHIICEVKRNGEWMVNVRRVFELIGANFYYTSAPCQDRDYKLFTILANVRRYDDSIIAIKDPKGIPEDCTLEWQELCKDRGGDFHSHSYITNSEFQAYINNNSLDAEYKRYYSNPLNELIEEYKYEDARLVFAFDN